MAQSFDVRDGDEGVPKFPGPFTLFPSRERWKDAIPRAGTFTILGIVMSFNAAQSGIFIRALIGIGTLVFGISTWLFMSMRLMGAGSLRFDKNGFEVKKALCTETYFWDEVSGFAAVTILHSRRITFTGSRGAYILDIYDKDIDELAQFMTTWQNSAKVDCEANARAEKIPSRRSPGTFWTVDTTECKRFSIPGITMSLSNRVVVPRGREAKERAGSADLRRS
jgi:hypothetical protein